MTKTLTEQWHDGTLPEGWYYLKVISEFSNYPVIAECVMNYSSLDPYSYFYEYDDSHIEEVLAPVLPYRVLYDKDQGIFPVLNIVLRNIEREQCRRKLTDLELSIKSQVKGVLAFNGLVNKTYESSGNTEQLEKKLEIATKALKEIPDLAGNNENGINDYGIVCCAQDSLKEMEGVK